MLTGSIANTPLIDYSFNIGGVTNKSWVNGSGNESLQFHRQNANDDPTLNAFAPASYAADAQVRVGVVITGSGGASYKRDNSGWKDNDTDAANWSGRNEFKICDGANIVSLSMRNLRRYNTTDHQEGKDIIDGLMEE